MILSLAHLEDQFLEAHSALGLPPTWQVIYQEAIRGNHILFAKGDVIDFRQTTMHLEASDDALSDAIEDAAYLVIAAPSFQVMAEIIDRCEVDVRRGLFNLYQRCIALWSQHLKISLH